MLLNIITPCTRLRNLPEVKSSIEEACKNIPLKIVWYIVVDSNKIKKNIPLSIKSTPQIKIRHFYESVKWSVFGNGQRNFALDKIKEGFVYFLDDDNRLHPDLVKVLYEKFKKFGQEIGLICQQSLYTMKYKRNRKRIRKVKFEKERIDTAQFVADISLIGDSRWVLKEYAADGTFILEVFNKNPKKFIILDKVLSYYNDL